MTLIFPRFQNCAATFLSFAYSARLSQLNPSGIVPNLLSLFVEEATLHFVSNKAFTAI
jgi:hypothetical protein